MDRKGLLKAKEALRVLNGISNEDAEIFGFNPKFSNPRSLIL